MLSQKENFLRVLRCEIPEYVPTYNLFWGINKPSFMMEGRNPDGTGKDMFGVEWVIENSAFPAALPKPGDFILDDIRKWRDVIKVRDFSDVDWEAVSKKDLERRNPDDPYGGNAELTIGLFQTFMSFMGFTDGLVACYEEPEEVKALLEYLTDAMVELGKKIVYYYKPDYGMFGDDIAHERNPFVSVEMFRDLFKPNWKRYADVFLEAGLPMAHHNCGHFEALLDDLVDCGFTAWDPVQSSNDTAAIKKKFGNKLALCGAFDSTPFHPKYNVTEEEVRAAVKDTLDRLAPGGGYCWFGGLFDADPVAATRNGWIQDEFEKLRYSYYK